MERLSQLAAHATAAALPVVHPFDPLTPAELQLAVKIVRAHFAGKTISFNVVTLKEPRKADYLAWDAAPATTAAPAREAHFVILESGVNGVIEGDVTLGTATVYNVKKVTGVQPILTVDDLRSTEDVIRKDPRVIEQCVLSGVPADEMHNVYCDPWTIGFDERWGTERRLQQALMYYRSNEDDSQYSHPLDFCPIVDTETHEVIFIDIPPIRRPLSKAPHSNFNMKDVAKQSGMRETKPINVTQPEGVSFKLAGRIMEWQNFRFHIGFNYREGIVLSDISYNDHGVKRPIFYRLSLAEMVVPYGSPEHPHQRKHAFDLGEYGAGYMTNPLTLGCDCKGVIHYLDGDFVDREGDVITTKNAICIHEEDSGILFKHSDFRDNFATSIVTRGTKLIISQIFTAANYEYMVYWNFHQDGTIQLEIKLTGILNTYSCNDDEDLGGFGTRVYPGVNAHNHQHLFSLRIHPRLDGDGNSVATVDAATPEWPVGDPKNKYGNAFMPKRTVLKTVKEAVTDYDGAVGRTWDIFNPKKLNKYSGKPVSYKLVSRECPPLLPKPGSLVWKRAGFARHHVHVVPYEDGRVYPAGEYVPQTSGEPSRGLPEWLGDGSEVVDDKDIIVYHTFGITHFPAPEDFPVMPAEPINLLLRPRNFFLQNPALDVMPSYNCTTTEAKKLAADAEKKSLTDGVSRLAFTESSGAGSCCKK